MTRAFRALFDSRKSVSLLAAFVTAVAGIVFSNIVGWVITLTTAALSTTQSPSRWLEDIFRSARNVGLRMDATPFGHFVGLVATAIVVAVLTFSLISQSATLGSNVFHDLLRHFVDVRIPVLRHLFRWPASKAAGRVLRVIIFLTVVLILLFVVVAPALLYIGWLLTSFGAYVVRTAATYNFVTSALLVGTLLALALTPHSLRLQSWKKLDEIWLKGPAAGAFGALGFGSMEYIGKLLQETSINLTHSQLSKSALVTIFLCTLGTWLIAYLVTMVGRSKHDEATAIPLLMFAVAFGCAWLANAGSYTLFMDGIILTLYTHLSA